MWTDKFISTLKKSTIDNPLIEEAMALKAAHLPRYLYRYRRVIDFSLNDLRNDTVWICSPEAYNDPYDCQFRITEADVVTAAKRGLVTEFVRIYRLKTVLSKDVIKEARASDDPLLRLSQAIPIGHNFPRGANPAQSAEFMTLRLPVMIADTMKFIRQVRQATKICSFSERHDSIVMWSHYAKNHTGFCIEYDIGKLATQCLLRRGVFPVVYSSRFFDLTQWSERLMKAGRKRFNPAMVMLAMIHKYKDWNYEKEWRYILTEPRLSQDRSMQMPVPSRVFIGARVSEKDRADLKQICAAKGIEIWQMEIAPDAFELRSSRFA